MKRLVVATFLAVLWVSSSAWAQDLPPDVRINEIRLDSNATGSDEDAQEFFELIGEPGTDLSDLTYVVLGDGAGGFGVIEELVDLEGEMLDENGFFVVADEPFFFGGTANPPDLDVSLNFENDNTTHLLVFNYDFAMASTIVNDDLDTDDAETGAFPRRGSLEITPWELLIDSVARLDPDVTDLVYTDNAIGPDPPSFGPAHLVRCPLESDLDVWGIGDFVVPALPEDAVDTPGEANHCHVAMYGPGGRTSAEFFPDGLVFAVIDEDGSD